MRFVLRFSALLLLAPLLSFGQTDASTWAPYHAKPLDQQLRLVRTGSAISWPVLGRQIAFQLGSQMAVRDEMPVRNLVLSSQPITLQLPVDAMEAFVQTDDPTGRFGFELRHKFDPTALVGVVAVRNSSFLNNLDTPSWNAYLGSLGGAPNARLVTNDDSDANPNVLQILGGRTRVLEYRFSGEEPEDPVRSVIQVFCDLPNGLLVIFTLECDSLMVPELGPDFETVVDSFDFPEEF